MSKSKKIRKKKQAPDTDQPTRRDTLKFLRNGALAVTATGAAGYWATGSFRAYAAEHDLSRLGQGAPVIVQVHDPQCSTCTALQKQARAALKEFDDCGLIYLVADIKTQDGAAFAARYGVPNITLLFFDGDGTLLSSVNGMHSSSQLSPLFAEHKAVTQA